MKVSRFLRLLKHIFIPHSHNDYKPHFFREHVVLSILIASLLLIVISYTSYTILRTTTFGSSVVASVLIDLTNQTRRQHNLPPLYHNQQLDVAATLKGEDMVSRGYFAHFAPDGTSPWYFIAKAGYTFKFAGENLAVNFSSSKDVENAWLASQKHRENILNPTFQDIGISTVKDQSARETPRIYVVQMFGTPDSAITSYSPSLRQEINPAQIYEKILFNASYLITIIYLILVTIIVVALLLMIFIEFKQQHYVHIYYGVLLIITVISCIAINSYLT